MLKRRLEYPLSKEATAKRKETATKIGAIAGVAFICALTILFRREIPTHLQFMFYPTEPEFIGITAPLVLFLYESITYVRLRKGGFFNRSNSYLVNLWREMLFCVILHLVAILWHTFLACVFALVAGDAVIDALIYTPVEDMCGMATYLMLTLPVSLVVSAFKPVHNKIIRFNRKDHILIAEFGLGGNTYYVLAEERNPTQIMYRKVVIEGDAEYVALLNSVDEFNAVHKEAEQIMRQRCQDVSIEDPSSRAVNGFIIENGILEDYVGPGGNVIIPQGVTEIGRGAFRCCDALTSVTIPEGVTSIGYNAFVFCESLTDVKFPKSLVSIGEQSFAHCEHLSTVEIPEGVTSVGATAFGMCSNLRSVVIPKSVTRIEALTFLACEALTNIIIPESVSHIGRIAFSGCRSLTSIEIPESVIAIESGAFKQCSSLAEVSCPERFKTCEIFEDTPFWNEYNNQLTHAEDIE